MAKDVVTIKPGGPFRGTLAVPGDKSMAHRALIFAALADGKSEIRNMPGGDDVARTRSALQQLGVKIETSDTAAVVHGTCGNFQTPEAPIDCGNSGTTLRLLAGLLAGAKIPATLIGDESLSRRPMRRIINPLAEMGAGIESKSMKAPLTIREFARYAPVGILTVNSAQVKSAILLAGLFVDGEILLNEPVRHRDHTERMLAALGVPVSRQGDLIRQTGCARPAPFSFTIPGDPSGAAFFAAAAAVVEGSEVRFENLSVNETRFGFFRQLDRAGATVVLENETEHMGEPVADVTVRYCRKLEPFDVNAGLVPAVIDEIPLIGALGCLTSGDTEVRDAEELRNKETDRIEAVCRNLAALGIEAKEKTDGFDIRPGDPVFADVQSFGDHRIAMAFAVLGAVANGVCIKGADAVTTSYPEFFEHLKSLCPDCSVQFEEPS